MNSTRSALDILEEERAKMVPSVPASLVEAVYRIEERVQFDVERPDAAHRIQAAIQAQMDKETLEREEGAHES